MDIEKNILKYYREYQLRGPEFGWEQITCSFEDHGILYTGLDSEFKIYLFCLECNYKMYPGHNLTQSVIEAVEKEINRNKLWI